MTENKRYYRDFGGENGTIIRDRITNEEVFEFGMSDSKDLCVLLNEQEETIQEYKHLVKIATNLIEWNTIPQIRRAWQKHLNKVGDD